MYYDGIMKFVVGIKHFDRKKWKLKKEEKKKEKKDLDWHTCPYCALVSGGQQDKLWGVRKIILLVTALTYSDGTI